MFKWSEEELKEFFEAESRYYEDTGSYLFESKRDGLRLLVTLFNIEGAVYVSVYRDGLTEPLIIVREEFCTHAQITKNHQFRRCFEAGSTKYPVTDMGIPPVLQRGVRVFVEPHFQVELIGRGSDLQKGAT